MRNMERCKAKTCLCILRNIKDYFTPILYVRKGREKKKNRGDSVNLFEIARYSKCVKLSER